MAGEFRMEINLPATRYVLNLAATNEVLSVLETFGDDCSSVCKTMRDDLRAAVALYEANGSMPDDEEPGISGEHEYRTALADAATSADAPRCLSCGAPAREIPAGAEDTEPLYVCDTPDCMRRDRPLARCFFDTAQADN